MAEDRLPLLEFRALGYACVANSSGGRAGVATLCRTNQPVFVVSRAVEELERGRRIVIEFGGLTIDNVYVPTRKAIGKVEFLSLLRRDYEPRGARPRVLCGDFNLCTDDRDFASAAMIAEPERFGTRDEDLAFRALRDVGLSDCFRQHCDEPGHYTWFDYRPWTLKRNYGMRLDYVFVSDSVRCLSAQHLLSPRTWAKPSDHLAVFVELER